MRVQMMLADKDKNGKKEFYMTPINGRDVDAFVFYSLTQCKDGGMDSVSFSAAPNIRLKPGVVPGSKETESEMIAYLAAMNVREMVTMAEKKGYLEMRDDFVRVFKEVLQPWLASIPYEHPGRITRSEITELDSEAQDEVLYPPLEKN